MKTKELKDFVGKSLEDVEKSEFDSVNKEALVKSIKTKSVSKIVRK